MTRRQGNFWEQGPSLPKEPRPATRARTGDPDTSHAAARGLDSFRPRQIAVLNVVRWLGPSTDVQIADAYNADDTNPPQSPSGLRTRRSELVAAGILRDSGKRGILPSGRKAILWEVTS